MYLHTGGGSTGQAIPAIAHRKTTRKIFLNFSENKSSDRKLSLIPGRVVRLLCRIVISKVLTEDILTRPLNRDWYQRHSTETSLGAWMISRA